MLPPTIIWTGDAARGHVEILDQTLLPARIETITLRHAAAMINAIRTLKIRGAPAIGVAGAYGLVLAMQPHVALSCAAFIARLEDEASGLAGARPTAVNLKYALDRVCRCVRREVKKTPLPPASVLLSLALDEAHAIHHEDKRLCDAIGEAGAPLIKQGLRVLTHCNAGALATTGIGTGLAPLFTAHRRGVMFKVWVDETRPLWQGARLTALELQHAGIDTTLICDNAAAWLMQRGDIDLVMVGADRIACNGDVANKIGTYALAVAAATHTIPFYVAAPFTTFDAACPDGSAIPVEERSPDEVVRPMGLEIAPPGIKAYNPAFDVTPAAYIRGIVTERGILAPGDVARAAKD